MKRKSTFVATISVLLVVLPACSPVIKNPGSTVVDVVVPTPEREGKSHESPPLVSDPNGKVTLEKKSRLSPSQGQAILDVAVEKNRAEFVVNYGGLIQQQQSMHEQLHVRLEQYRRQLDQLDRLNRFDRPLRGFGELMSLNPNRSGIQAVIAQLEGDIIKVEENFVILENKRDLNLLAVSWRRLTHRQRLDVLHSECLSEFNKTELLKVQDVPDTDKIPSFKNGVGMVLRQVPTGKFDMGASGSVLTQNAGRVRKVSISSSFWMGETEVTQEQFLSVCGYNPSEYIGEKSGDAKVSTELPVDNATWFEAVRYCKRLSEMQSERKQGNTYRLPTEAEWEYVCRAGTKTPFSFGGFEKLIGMEANVDYSNLNRPSVGHIVPARSYAPNNFGFWDMHGNASEWCSDWFADDYYDKAVDTDPAGPTPGRLERKVVRGDSCFTEWDATSGCHRRDSQVPTVAHIGFRVVCEKGSPSAIAAMQFRELAEFDSRKLGKQ